MKIFESLSIQSIKLMARTDRAADQWSNGATHYQCKITRSGYHPTAALGTYRDGVQVTSNNAYTPLITEYSMGSAYTKPPKVKDVIASLVRDAQFSSEPFADFCANLGYDTDSRRALAIYEQCAQTAQDLRQLFSSTELAELTEWSAEQ